jgi:glycosyltransferase involved in cell wall biosynthesis
LTSDFKMPLVSILVPLYNAQEFITHTLNSIFSQDYIHLEVIIVDDCSTDASFQIVSDYLAARNERRIKLFRNEKNLGPEGNWNKALSLANGKYIKLVCSDDTLEPGALTKQVKVFENPENSGVALVTGSRVIINSKGERLGQRGNFKNGRLSSILAMKQVIRAGTNPLGEPAAGLFKKTDAHKIGGYRMYSPYAIDVDFWMRLLQLGDLWFISEPISTFRISKKSCSSIIGLRQSKDFRTFIYRSEAENPVVISRFDSLIGSLKSMPLGILRVAYFKIFA